MMEEEDAFRLTFYARVLFAIGALTGRKNVLEIDTFIKNKEQSKGIDQSFIAGVVLTHAYNHQIDSSFGCYDENCELLNNDIARTVMRLRAGAE